MSLTSALSTAQSIFTNTGTQSSVAAKNIANAQNPDYVRRSAVVLTGGNGAYIGDIVRANNAPLFRQTIESTSISSGQRTLLNGLTEVKSLMGGNDYETSPAALLSNFREAMDAFAAKANDVATGLSALSSAQDLAKSLSKTSNELQSIRKRADQAIEQNVNDLNTLLQRFDEANSQVKNLTASGGDPNDALDQREAIFKKISEIVGVSSYVRDGNDMVLHTTDGTTLYEAGPRKVTFKPTVGFDAATKGGGVYIDGVEVKAGTAGDTTAKGSLPALLQLRDDIAPTFQKQLDEIARGLITAFAETDPAADPNAVPPVPAVLPPRTGLFTFIGAPTIDDGAGGILRDSMGNPQVAVPDEGVLVTGLASRLIVNPAVIPPAGSPNKIRDGGINGPGYLVNEGGNASYAELLDKYNQALEQPMSFDNGTLIADSKNLTSFATNSVGWLEDLRSSASAADETKYAMLSRSFEAYSSSTGVSLDEELSLLLDIEQSYKAAAKLMATVDEMMQALLDIAS